MTRQAGLPFALALLLTACQVTLAPPAAPPKRTAAQASPAAATPASAAPSRAPAALAKLVKPAGTLPLGGRVTLDAGYMVAAGAGNILSHNGGQIVAAGGLNLIGADGATLVGMDGASIVAAGAGNLVAAAGDDGPAAIAAAGSALIGPDGASLVGPDGASVVGHNGGSVVGHNGGSVVGHNGGSVVGHNGAAYALAQAPGPKALTLPAAGMMVWVRSLVDGQPVPLGADAAGRTVWAVYTDAAGRYEVHLPEALAENVVIEAEKPFARDLRLAVRSLSDPSGTRDVSEASTAVAQALRDTMSAKFTRILALADQLRAEQGKSDDEIVKAFFANSKSTPEAIALVSALVRRLLDDVKAAGIPQADYPRLALALGDRVLATGGTLDGVTFGAEAFGAEFEPALVAQNPYYGKDALVALEGIFRDVIAWHEGRSGDELEAFYAAKPYVKLANGFAARDGRAPYAIRKGADFARFVQREYLGLVQGEGYGCATGECRPEPAGCDYVTTALACIPATGAGPLSSSQIRALTEAVLVDIGLPGSHAYIVNGASIAIGTKFGVAAAARPDLLSCTIRAFKAGGGRCE